MLFIMFCELLYPTFRANVDYWMATDTLPSQFGLVPWIGVGVQALILLWMAFFRGLIPVGKTLREHASLKAFREASALRCLIVAAATIWVVLFPDNEAQLSAFGLLIHNFFFIFFNAAIGLLFLRLANRSWGGLDAGLQRKRSKRG